MDRKEFLSAIGLSAAGLMLGSCLGGCKKENEGGNAPNVDFTFDLNDPNYSLLNNNGSYKYANGVIIARTSGGQLIAVSQSCTHEGQSVQYRSGSNDFYCQAHGATFSSTGAATSQITRSPLKQYTVTVNGTSVRVNG